MFYIFHTFEALGHDECQISPLRMRTRHVQRWNMSRLGKYRVVDFQAL